MRPRPAPFFRHPSVTAASSAAAGGTPDWGGPDGRQQQGQEHEGAEGGPEAPPQRAEGLEPVEEFEVRGVRIIDMVARKKDLAWVDTLCSTR